MRIKTRKTVKTKESTLYEYMLVCGNCGHTVIAGPLPERAELGLLSSKCEKCDSKAKDAMFAIEAKPVQKKTVTAKKLVVKPLKKKVKK